MEVDSEQLHIFYICFRPRLVSEMGIRVTVENLQEKVSVIE